jgi:hypothetical protein
MHSPRRELYDLNHTLVAAIEHASPKRPHFRKWWIRIRHHPTSISSTILGCAASIRVRAIAA